MPSAKYSCSLSFERFCSGSTANDRIGGGLAEFCCNRCRYQENKPIPIPTSSAAVMPSFTHDIASDTGIGADEIGKASDQFTPDFTVVSLTNCSPSPARPSFAAVRAVTSAENGAGPLG